MRLVKPVILIITLLLCFSYYSSAQEVKRTAKILEIKGKADIRLFGQKEWIPAETEMLLNEGDILKTRKESRVIINLDGMGETATVEIEENSQLMLSELVKDNQQKTQNTLLDLGIGKILIRAKQIHNPESKFEVKTPTSVVGVRGTTFSVEVESLE